MIQISLTERSLREEDSHADIGGNGIPSKGSSVGKVSGEAGLEGQCGLSRAAEGRQQEVGSVRYGHQVT